MWCGNGGLICAKPEEVVQNLRKLPKLMADRTDLAKMAREPPCETARENVEVHACVLDAA